MKLQTERPSRYHFKSRRPNEAHGVIASFFEPSFKLEVEDRSGFDFSLDFFPCGPGVSISRLAFRADVTVEIDRVDAFMVQMPLSGRNDLSLGGARRNRLLVDQRLFSVIGPERSLRQHRTPDCRMVLVRFDSTDIGKCLAAHAGREISPDAVSELDFTVAMSAGAASSAPWLRLMSYLLGELDREGSIFLSPLAAAQAGQLLMSTLLLHQPHNYSALLQRPDCDLSPRFLREAEEFLQSHADQPITADDIARRLNISTRSVYAGFRQHLSTTPMQHLKNIRLERARADLLAARDGVSVTTVAMAWGFTHLGKFSGEYRARFGELPSQTLRTAKAVR